ncbi:hypothetical protein [Methylomicrobium lacus]|jgi:hypothetical protein|uniref:hypothetical protein n=1 Tax=Methylomicrobium lacus TaxID=136992 RepID=UPI0035A981DE
MIVLWLLALLGIVSSVALLLAALIRLTRFERGPFAVPALHLERQLLWLALIAALLGSLGLFVLPAYTSISCSASISVSGNASGDTPLLSPCTASESSATFVQVNGPQVIPLFTIPVVFALVPLGCMRLRVRAVVFAICAFVLAGQAAIGMSGYGLAFAPSSVFLVAAGFVGIFRRSA